VRARTWWEFKTPIILGVAYLSACVEQVSFDFIWPKLFLLVAALIPLASYVCVINDITDESDDRRAGKTNAMAGKSWWFKAAWLLACVLAGVLAAWLLSPSPAALLLYLANWFVFTLYSVPPVRLKKRGVLGVVADACGGQLLPSLWVAFLVNPSASAVLIVLLSVWAFALGLRGILFHQAGDCERDRESGVQTLAVRLGLKRLARVVHFIVFPIELISLGALLWLSGSIFALPLLAVYAFFQFALWRWLRVEPVVAIPSPCCRLLMLKYYQVYFPLTFVFALSLKSPWVLACIPAHGVLFPDTWRRFFEHAVQIRHNIQYPPDWEKLNRA
jgi:4-hydroxybenzoate polyprenyltransferase